MHLAEAWLAVSRFLPYGGVYQTWYVALLLMTQLKQFSLAANPASLVEFSFPFYVTTSLPTKNPFFSIYLPSFLSLLSLRAALISSRDTKQIEQERKTFVSMFVYWVFINMLSLAPIKISITLFIFNVCLFLCTPSSACLVNFIGWF